MGWRNNNEDVDFSVLAGKVLTEVRCNEDNSEMYFIAESGEQYLMHHEQDCCESVYINDIEGDLQDLIGKPIVLAEQSSNSDPVPGQDLEWVESFTWTFYRIATEKGFVVIRWLGESNGYYSESVDFELIK